MTARTPRQNTFQKKKHPGQRNRRSYYLTQHMRALFFSVGQLFHAPFMSLMTFLIIGIALALPTGLIVMLQNAKSLSQNWNNSTQISLYLKMDLPQYQAEDIINQLKELPTVAEATYISPEQGIMEFKKRSGLGDAITALNKNPLPGLIQVTPTLSHQSPHAIEQLLHQLKQMPEVDLAQLDMAWVKRLFTMINLADRAIIALGILLGLGVLLIIGNTINLTLQRFREEIEICKLMGATDAFVRRPYLYLGIVYGLLGGITAWLLITLTLLWLHAPIQNLIELYNSHFQLLGLTLHSSMKLLGVGILLGSSGSWFAVGKHLKHISSQ